MTNESQSPLSLPLAAVDLAAVDRATLARLPKEVAAEFQVVFFKETDTALSLGVVHPELLKEQANRALAVLEQQVGKRIELFRLQPDDYRRVFALYDQPDSGRTTRGLVSKKDTDLDSPAESQTAVSSYKPGGAVNEAVLTKIPLDYIRRYRVIAVDRDPEAGLLWFITDRPSDLVDSVLSLIARRNRVEPILQIIDGGEFNRVLRLATELFHKEDVQKRAVAQADKLAAEGASAAAAPAAPVAPEETVAEPEPTDEEEAASTPGRILTGQVEKGGLAGLFQRAAAALGRRGEPNQTVTPPAPEQESEAEAEPVTATPEKTAPPVPPATTVAAPTKAAVPAPGASSGSSPSDGKLSVPPPKESSFGQQPTGEAPLVTPAKSLTHPQDEKREKGGGGSDKKKGGAKKEDDQTPVIRELAALSGGGKSGSSTDQEVNALFRRPVTDMKQLQLILTGSSVPRMVAGVINYAVFLRASDVHMEPYGEELLIRYRVDGQLTDIVKLPMSVHPAIVSRIKILSKLKLDESRIPQDGRFDVLVEGTREIDIRVSTLPTVHGEKVVMRILDKSEGIYTLEKLGLMGHGFDVVVEAIKRSYGVLLSTGPTGSGKTTTLYAVLQRVATANVNVVTLEDPVEYEMEGINQSQIKPKIGFTFADGLRSVLRQDPNIIMVGEVRDAETASMVTHAALTGHLVLSTLHTNDASGALPRLINMGVEPFLITSAMNAIIGQRLVRRLCEKCRQEVELPSTVRHEIDEELTVLKTINKKDAERIPEKIQFYRPGSCPECNNGYKGRVGLFEVLAMSDTIEELAIKKAPAADIRHAASKKGMITMKQDGILKVLAGLTSLDEVLRETSSR